MQNLMLVVHDIFWLYSEKSTFSGVDIVFNHFGSSIAFDFANEEYKNRTLMWNSVLKQLTKTT